jgi:hypothetical protein
MKQSCAGHTCEEDRAVSIGKSYLWKGHNQKHADQIHTTLKLRASLVIGDWISQTCDILSGGIRRARKRPLQENESRDRPEARVS